MPTYPACSGPRIDSPRVAVVVDETCDGRLPVMADDPFDRHLDEPTPEQLEAARHAGWNTGSPGDEGYPIAPPAGWEAHALDPGPVAFLEASDLAGEDE